MSAPTVDIEAFLQLAQTCPVVDVRSPAEFSHAHIPLAHNIPLFDNDERKIVGTIYKQQGRQSAIKAGLQLVGKKTVSIIDDVEDILKQHPAAANTVLVHCWRGGMRSGSVAWLLGLYGFNVVSLRGGYKGFRQWVSGRFLKNYNLSILGGFTGSGKTGVLQQMSKSGAVAIDLEALASHKGSSFGSVDMPGQPSQEMFENLLACDLHRAGGDVKPNARQTIWLEDESQRIGDLIVPGALWKQMRLAPVFFMEVPFEERINHLVNEYGRCSKDQLESAIMRIQKRLGGAETKLAIQHLQNGSLADCAAILLKYYDRHYQKGLQKRDALASCITHIPCTGVNAVDNAAQVLSSRQVEQ